MDAGQFRARSGTEIMDAAFQLVKANYAPLVTIAALGSAPGLLMALTDPLSVASDEMETLIIAAVFKVLYAITVLIMQIALIRTISDIYMGRPVDIAASIRIKGITAARIMGVGTLSVLLIALGMIFLIVPGLIIMASFSLAPAIIVLEDASIAIGLQRSWFLSGGRRLAILGAILVFFIVIILCSIASGILMVKSAYVLGNITGTLLALLVAPLYPAFMTLHYYDARIRKEGYDIELMAQVATS